MRPDFGCGIHQLVFSLNDAATLGRARELVRTALIRWEPRIDILDVTAEPRGDGAVLLINVRYLVRTTNNLFNFVYPFYLRGPEGE
jgi:phage baseplate assembly protein W